MEQAAANTSGSIEGTGSNSCWPTINDIPELVDPVDDKLKCLECNNVLRDPVQTPCGHRFCRSCLDGLLRQTGSILCPGGEEDCTIVTKEQIIADFSVKKELMRLNVHCPMKRFGCQTTVKWGRLSAHLNQDCQHRYSNDQQHELKNQLVTLERKYSEVARELMMMKEENRQQREFIKSMDANYKILMQKMENNVKANDVIDTVRRHDRQLTIVDVRLAEADLRMLSMESTNYSGVLIWKIPEYSRRKREAVAGTTLSLYSQPFFTSRYGYRLCARAYPNGDGQGRDTHFSLFFVVMKGEYDNLLQWPFREKVTLTMMDQDTGRRNMSDSFRPDPSSSSFRKPTSEMNVASGCPLFMRHSQLEQSPYLKDDCIFIKITVDTSNLSIY